MKPHLKSRPGRGAAFCLFMATLPAVLLLSLVTCAPKVGTFTPPSSLQQSDSSLCHIEQLLGATISNNTNIVTATFNNNALALLQLHF